MINWSSVRARRALRLALFVFVLASAVSVHAGDTAFVQVLEARIRPEPKQWVPGLLTVRGGDAVEKLAEADDWAHVRTANGTVGYLHLSALTDSPPAQGSTTRLRNVQRRADPLEASIAGKGFPESTRRTILRRHKLNLAALKRMLARRVTDAELAAFVRAGELEGRQ